MQTKSHFFNTEWILEKTSGTIVIKNEIKETNGTNNSFEKSINYSGSLISAKLNDFILIKSLTNFGMTIHPEGFAWSDLFYEKDQIYAINVQEKVGFQIPIAYKTTVYPFIGYSYLKLDYMKNDYSFLPTGFYGHTIYHDFLFGSEQNIYVTKWFNFTLKGMITPFSDYYPRKNFTSQCLEIGTDLNFDFEYFGLHLYFSDRRTLEFSSNYSQYKTYLRDFGFTFRIGLQQIG